MQRLLLLSVLLLVPAACGRPPEPSAARPPAEIPNPGTEQATSTEGAPPALRPARLVHALDPLEADVWEGPVLWMDFGTQGSAKYTLGGWRTGFGEVTEVEGAPATLLSETRGTLFVPWPSPGRARVTVSYRAFRRGTARFLVNGQRVHEAAVSAGPQTAEFAVDLASGDPLLGIEGPPVSEIAPRVSASLAVSWVRLAPDGDAAAVSPSPPRGWAQTAAGVAALRLSGALRLVWRFQVPASGLLRGVWSDARGPLSLTIAESGAGARSLSPVVAGPFDIDLASASGELVRLEARGEGTWAAPAVMTATAPSAAVESGRARNVLIYLVDTLRHDKLRPYNPSTRVRTPGLDRFVENATALTGGHAQENWTKPSVATLLSGIFPWQHTAFDGDSVLPESVEMISETLRERGFFTGAFIANGYVSDRFGFKQGWNTYRNYIREGLRTPAQYVAADVLEWLDRRPADKPFLLYVHTIDPHVPYRPPEEFLSLYDAEPYRGPVSFSRDATLLENIKVGRLRLNERDKERLVALYDGEISYHDVHFNAIIEALERRNLADETIVVLTSDHGEEFWDHGSVGHGHSVYEELLHVPLFVRLPGQRGARKVEDSVGLVDVLPTIFASLGMDPPGELEGHSLLPLILGQNVARRRFTVSGFMDRDRVIVADRYKLIHRGLERFQLYDLVADPHEQTDLGAERPEVVRALRGMLGLRLAETRPGPVRSRTQVRAPHEAQTTTIDPQLEAQLRALGYVQ